MPESLGSTLRVERRFNVLNLSLYLTVSPRAIQVLCKGGVAALGGRGCSSGVAVLAIGDYSLSLITCYASTNRPNFVQPQESTLAHREILSFCR